MKKALASANEYAQSILFLLFICVLFMGALDTNDIVINEQLACPKGDHTFRDTLPSPVEGQIIRCTTHDRIETYDGSAWEDTRKVRYPITANTLQGDYAVLEILTTGNDNVPFWIPSDFHELVSYDIIVIPETTKAAADVDLNSDYGAVGESETIHSESNTAITYNWTAGQKFAADSSSVLSAIAADDDGGINWKNNTTGVVNILWTEMVYR